MINKQPLFKAAKPKTKKKSNAPVVFLLKLEFPDKTPVKIELPKTLDDLYKKATHVLNLQRPAKHVFDEEGIPFNEIAEIPPKATLYVSSADIKAEEDDDELNLYRKKSPAKSPVKKLPLVKTKPPPTEPENKKDHNTIASVPYTVKDNLRDALLCLYTSMTDEQKQTLNCGDALSTLLDEYQYYLVQHELFRNFIGPSTAVFGTDLGQLTSDWIVDRLKEIKVEFCKFTITGPPQSGKTTLLSQAALIFYQKLLITRVAQKYLMVPINWKILQGIVNDIPKLYNFYIKVTLSALKAVRLDLIPILPTLQKWFESIIVMKSFGNFPPLIQEYTKFPHQKVMEYGRKIHNSWLAENKFHEFLSLITEMPTHIASAFELSGAVFIMDHFDCCGYQITKDGETLDLGHYVSLSISNSPFFVASQDDHDFFNVFEVEKHKTITTTGIITDVEEKSIIISNPNIELKLDMLKGCPGYYATYFRLCDIIDRSNDKIAIKRPNLTPFKSVVDINRQVVAKQELLRFCLILESAQDSEMFDAGKMNQLMVQDFEARVQ
ncbi:hypothetical protein TRFO_11739 [Tritrichomonas foetus]|uniref:Uncharacterized protein n=1 Tax=Tritrichomonas foetus TaxID=1144522 RepID=A0A1J4J2D2_9EUKA|nr:hypothetical protein TRFO_11739 [Tritrichomonas foetus]|eukprot:OHS93530.1 hypothetical protein TRFO_11739 [Tritrichomonas foetus]